MVEQDDDEAGLIRALATIYPRTKIAFAIRDGICYPQGHLMIDARARLEASPHG
jgi:hypothetical protein